MTPNTPASAPKNPLRANTAFQRTAAALALNQLSDAMSLITITFMVIAMNGSPELASLVLFCCSFTAITAGIISGPSWITPASRKSLPRPFPSRIWGAPQP